jgi:hypothetical protein
VVTSGAFVARVRFLPSVVLVAVLWAVGGCATVRVSTDYDPRADLAALRTYGWRSKRAEAARDPRLDNSLLDARIRSAVDRELAARGMVKVPADPDFHASYDVVLEKEVRFTTVGGWYHGWGWGWGYPQTHVRAYDRTILILDFTDADTGNLLWRGMAWGNLIADASPEEREAEIDTTVTAILDRFPPQN